MIKKYISVMKWAAPIFTITLAFIQLANIPFPDWLAVSLLIVTAILYTASLLIEKKHSHK